MPRITTVKSARLVPVPRKCGRCGKAIEAGDTYHHWSIRLKGARGGSTYYRCAEHYPRPSETTTSPYKAAAYGASEEVEDTVGREGVTPEEIADALREAAETVRGECAEPLGESADSIEDGFGHETYQSSELRERADAFEEWASELESAADEIDVDAEQCEDACEECDACTEYADALAEAISKAEEVLGSCPE